MPGFQEMTLLSSCLQLALIEITDYPIGLWLFLIGNRNYVVFASCLFSCGCCTRLCLFLWHFVYYLDVLSEFVFLDVLVYCSLDALLVVDYFLDEHLRLVFRIVALGNDSVILGIINALDSLGNQLLLLFRQLPLFSLMLFYFQLEHLGNGLVS